MKTERLYVLAANYNQAQLWARNNGIPWSLCRYITDSRTIEGLGAFHFVHVPPAYRRHDYFEIRGRLNHRVIMHGAKELTTFESLDQWLNEQKRRQQLIDQQAHVSNENSIAMSKWSKIKSFFLRLMRWFSIAFLIGALCGAIEIMNHACFGQEVVLDGVARLTFTDGPRSSEWSGVAISEDTVLTCEHHNHSGKVRIEFCVDQHGSPDRVCVEGQIVKVNDAMDLSLISYRAPKWARVRFYRLNAVEGNGQIKGFLRGQPVIRKASPGRRGIRFNGRLMVEVNAITDSGMSGSPLIVNDDVSGILLGGDSGGISHCVSVGTVRSFLEGR